MKGKSTLLLLAAGILSLAGCQKTGLIGNDELSGSAIRFSATASTPATKTVYGVFDDDKAPTWQSIDWTTSDQIRIYSDAAMRRVDFDAEKTGNDAYYWADYGVTGITAGTASTKQSTATLTNLTPGYGEGKNGLVWGNATNAKFYAIYPMPATEDGKGNAIDGTKGILAGSIPAAQTFAEDGTIDMSYAFMTAVGTGAKPETDNVKNVELDFYPAFTAFEISLVSDTAVENPVTVTKFELVADSNSPALTGDFTVSYSGVTETTKSVTCSGTGKTVTFTFPEGTTITASDELKFTLFALPQTLTGLTLRFTILEDDDTPVTRSLKLTSKGEFISFDAFKKHRIYGLVLPQNIFNFKMINLNGEAIEWNDVEIEADNKDYPEATQFEVEGVNNGRYYTTATQTEPVEGRNAKAYRQYWLMDANHPATIKFKVMSPIGFDWLVVPEGDVDAYTITSNVDAEGYTAGGLRGPILTEDGKATTTNVILYVSAASADTAEHTLNFKTYVISKDDSVQYSLDTETQLVDFRGYHYFILNNSTIVK